MGCAGEAAGLMVRTTPEGWLVDLKGSKGGLYGKQVRAAPEQGAATCRRWKGQEKRTREHGDPAGSRESGRK